MTESWKPDICIYHGNCDDGFGAAWAIWKRWGNEVAYVPGVYGKSLPDVAGRHVLFVDFSAKRAEIDAMAQVAASIVIIDHHKTAEADLEPFKIGLCGGAQFVPENLDGMFRDMAELARPPILAWFDMEQSGAAMAWKFVYPDAIIPKFLRYIEDRDLWKFQFDDRTKKFSAALRTYPMDFKTWDSLIIHAEDLADEGGAILRAHNVNIQKFLDDAYEDKIGGHYVPVVNVPGQFASDVGNALLRKFPKAPFSATWHRTGDGDVKISLRSEDSRLDVSKIAAAHGGGGHRNAAGWRIPA